MSERAVTLPPGFEALEPFAGQWVAASADERAQLRISSTEEERAAFYAAAQVHLASALDRLDEKPLSQLNEQEHRLMQLMLSFAHVAAAIEVIGVDEPRHAAFARHMKITRAPADFGPRT